jgi:hypothetical protein
MSEAAEKGRMVRKRRNRVEVEQIVVEFEASGLTRQAFCSQHGLSVTALDKYRRRRQDVSPSRPVPMIPVQLCSRSPQASSLDGGISALLVELRNGRRIGVGRGFDAVTLERLLTVVDKAYRWPRSHEGWRSTRTCCNVGGVSFVWHPATRFRVTGSGAGPMAA